MASEADQGGFDFLITIIFVFVAAILLFPLNVYLPVDRRLGSMIGAVLCMMIIYAFPYERSTNIGAEVDFGVLIVLTSIMAINFVLLRQDWVKIMTDKIQTMIREDVERGFYAVSLIAMIASPFITNDGLCLMLVHPVLDAFQSKEASTGETSRHQSNSNHLSNKKSDPKDANNYCSTDPFYFMLTIACSANTGSAMTYTGNPQNIIVASYLSKNMSGGAFFALMVIPSLLGWGITAYILNSYRKQAALKFRQSFGDEVEKQTSQATSLSKMESSNDYIGEVELNHSPMSIVPRHDDFTDSIINEEENKGSSLDERNSESQRSLLARSSGWDVITAPYIVLVSIVLIMTLEFTGAVPLVGLFAFTSVIMVTSVILYNYYSINYQSLSRLAHQGIHWQEILSHFQTNQENRERLTVINDFIEELFRDIDYNLLIIFIGLFVVSGSFLLTHIPQTIWTGIAGQHAFTTVGSTISICIYILLACQLIGNVPVVFMAEKNVSALDRDAQIFGWLILAFVSTIAGNFTLVGSAANIIVAEKAMRHKICPVNIPAVPHFRFCGPITLLCIVIGIIILYIEKIIFL